MKLWTPICGLLLALTMLVPLSIKWQLNNKVAIVAGCFIGTLAGVIANSIAVFRNLEFLQILILEIFLISIISISLLLWRFYRDPERVAPEDENAILSPADGEVKYVKTIEKGKVPFSEKKGRNFSLQDFAQSNALPEKGHLIGIAMNYLDVHVNRAPVSGRICFLKQIKGVFFSLKKAEAVIQNERTLIVIENDRFRLGIIQIASRLVRKIVPYIREGQEIRRGSRIGIIRFGSQVDLILPDLPTICVEVNPGQKVKAGISIIARSDASGKEL